MAKRRSLEIPGIGHGNNPIPFGSVVNGMLFSGGIMGADPATGKVAETAEQQAALIFQHMRTLCEMAGGSTDDIGHVNVFLKDLSLRDVVNKEWVAMFPDEHSRPTRHTHHNPGLAGNTMMQCQIMAVVGQ